MYYIVGTEKQYEELQEELRNILPESGLISLHDKVTVLDKHYGNARNLQKDLGGYCAVFPTAADWKESYQTVLEKHYIQEELYEYRETVAEGKCCWIEVLYLIQKRV